MGRTMSRRRRTSQAVIAIKTTNTWAGLTLRIGALKGRPYGRSGAWGARRFGSGERVVSGEVRWAKTLQDAGATRVWRIGRRGLRKVNVEIGARVE